MYQDINKLHLRICILIKVKTMQNSKSKMSTPKFYYYANVKCHMCNYRNVNTNIEQLIIIISMYLHACQHSI